MFLTKWEQSLVALYRYDNVVDIDVGTVANTPKMDIDVGDASKQFRVDFDLSQPNDTPSIYSECQDLEDMRAWLISLERAGLSKWKGYEHAQDLLGAFLGIDIRNQLTYVMTRDRKE